jgi:hypothetical protein
VVGDRKDGALDWSEMGNGLVRTLRGLRRLFFGEPILPSHDDGEDESDDDDDEETQRRRRHAAEDAADGSSQSSLRRWFRLRCRRPWASCARQCINGSCRPHRHGSDRLFSRVLTVGKNIFSLYVRDLRAKSSRTSSVDEEGGSVLQQVGTSSFDPMDANASSQPVPRRHAKKWLDLDAIDTSSMETNVHQLRHAYFDLNKILVEDLHELIVTGKRAAERSLLLHREGNIFSFCQAPACVVNQ